MLEQNKIEKSQIFLTRKTKHKTKHSYTWLVSIAPFLSNLHSNEVILATLCPDIEIGHPLVLSSLVKGKGGIHALAARSS